MAYCRNCNVEQMGGSRCSRCGRRLVKRKPSTTEAEETKAGAGPPRMRGVRAKPLPEIIEFLERESRYKVERKRKPVHFYIVAFVARCMESVIFCVALHFILITVIFLFSVITELMRTGGDIYESSWLKEMEKGVQFYEYFLFVMVIILTFKYRWPKK